MNSRSSVNESNLVDFTADLTTFNQLDSKDGLLTFPFDHIYACHSDTSDRRPTLELDKEVEISTQCVVTDNKDLVLGTSSEITRLTDKLSAAESQNKRLKDLLVYHLDLIQQQNDIITRREKVYKALKQENDTLKNKLNKRIPSNQRQSLNPAPLLDIKAPSTSTVVKTEPSSQLMLDSFSELLLPDTRTNSFIYDGDINKNTTLGQEGFQVKTDTDISYVPSVSSFLDNNYQSNNSTYTMIESKRSLVKKEMKTEPRPEPLYTVTSNSGHQVIQRVQRNSRRSTGIGSMSRMAKRPPTATKTEADCKAAEENTSFDHTFTINKKNKMINTYSKAKGSAAKKTMSQFAGCVTDRLQLIDKTPTGEDPYQLGEADLREQSPIPKLMLAKTKNSRLRRTQHAAETSTSSLLFDESADANSKGVTKVNLDRFNFPTFGQEEKEAKTDLLGEPDLDLVKSESTLDWSIFANKTPGAETSLCDFSYGETTNNLAANLLPTLDFQELFANDASLNFDLNSIDFSLDNSPDKSKKRAARTTSLIAPPPPVGEGTAASDARGTDSKRGGRKRALSTNAKGTKRQPAQKGIMAKSKMTKGKSLLKGKKAPPPGVISKKQYHTLVGDPDLSWYYGLDPDLKVEDVDPTDETKISTVEVPRWREKSVTSGYSLEGTENLDDKIFEKRHQKLELEERRQLRWHMRRVREQRHVERLRLRQRDAWSSSQQPPPAFTIWPRPQRDCKYIEITDRLPVMALGEALPDLPPVDFTLPWVRTSRAQKRSKRAKTTPH